jgi:hypothetical protein
MAFALLVTAGEREGEVFPITLDRAFTVGRDPTNDIRLVDRKLSRIHCQVQVIGGRCQVSDLNSTNGTVVNGARIRTETWISLDDEIEIGMTRMRLIQMKQDDDSSSTGTLKSDPPSDVKGLSPAGAGRCEECGRAISAAEIQAKRVRKVGSRYYCLSCSASFDENAAPNVPPPEPLTGPAVDRGQPGKEIAGVRVIAKLGEGRLGPLFKGEQISMGRLVTVKMLNVAEPQWAQQYLHAVYTSGQLVHANIVLIFDTGEENGVFYIVREFVEGQSVQERMANRDPMPLADAYNVITQIGNALEHASERHITHGCLSPRKVILGPRDATKVTGFGLPRTPPPGRTAASYTWHSAAYTAPELLRGDETPNFASDVYSAVAIFYQLLTGRPPFHGSTREKLEHRILNNAPRPLRDLVPELPDAAQKIADRGLSKDPRSRYQSPKEFLFDLEENLRREL